MKIANKLFFIISAMIILSNVNAEASYWERPVVKDFVSDMVKKHHFNKDELKDWFSESKKRQSIIDAMMRPAEKVKPWKDYRKIFLTDKRITKGVAFWQQNRELLEKAEAKFGVAAEIIVAIIGVETYYGRQSGRYPVIDALATLGFDYPPRAAFFKKELEQYLLLVRDENLDTKNTLGSYAGAMGYGQFMPSSYLMYSLDHDKDGSRDLLNNLGDAIASVANYFKAHGWKKDEVVVIQAQPNKKFTKLKKQALKPSLTVKQLNEMGYTTEKKLDKNAMVSLTQLQQKDSKEYWFGMHNFYVITRYNHSEMYAMAVYQLSQEILSSYKK